LVTIGAVLSAAACSGSTEDGTPPGPSTANPLDAEESAMVQAVNDLRGDNGIQMLKDCATLNVSASKHSDDMRDQGYLDDVAPDGSTPRSRACEAGYQSACSDSSAMAELVASGIETAEGSLGQWTKDEKNRNLLIDPNLVALGVGRADGGESPYWTLDLGSAVEPSCDQAPGQ
jgi:uncharacterized protein YkwD